MLDTEHTIILVLGIRGRVCSWAKIVQLVGPHLEPSLSLIAFVAGHLSYRNNMEQSVKSRLGRDRHAIESLIEGLSQIIEKDKATLLMSHFLPCPCLDGAIMDNNE